MRQAVALTVLLSAAACATSRAKSGGEADGGSPDDTPDAMSRADAENSTDGRVRPDAAVEKSRRVVILMIGDGMGPGQLAGASYYGYGEAGRLALQSLPVHGRIDTASLSGITDSAAAATTMATGAVTYNGRIGLDRSGAEAESLVEAAHRLDMSAGIVTTASIPHATPAAFTAHDVSRHNYVQIADDQVLRVRPEIMLGGGMQYFAPRGGSSLRDDDGLLTSLTDANYTVVTTADELSRATADTGTRIAGLFADHHMSYVMDRTADSTEPSLRDMALSAVDVLDRDPEGFFLMIEGARIDMASHGNDAARAITETVAFDETVAAVRDWAADRDDVTIVVTADHECGGLEIVTPYGPGQLADVAWRWGNHTNAQVDLYGSGPGLERLDGADTASYTARDFTWVHEVLLSRVEGREVVAPPSVLTPDGSFDDLRYRATEQRNVSGFGVGFNQLDTMYIDVDAENLGIGIEGVFQWGANAVVLLIDVDFGASTGAATLVGSFGDTSGIADAIVSALEVDGSALAGFGAEYALVISGGADPHLEDLLDTAGIRGLSNVADPNNLAWYGAAINFADDVRAASVAMATVPGRGLEVSIPLRTLYQQLPSGVPAGATIAVAALLVNTDGGFSSNQALPPFAAGTDNPGRDRFSLPGVVRFTLDTDDDGIADGANAPTIR